MSKKLRKTTDPYVGVLLVVPKSTAERWRSAAARAGQSIHEWATIHLAIPSEN